MTKVTVTLEGDLSLLKRLADAGLEGTIVASGAKAAASAKVKKEVEPEPDPNPDEDEDDEQEVKEAPKKRAPRKTATKAAAKKSAKSSISGDDEDLDDMLQTSLKNVSDDDDQDDEEDEDDGLDEDYMKKLLAVIKEKRAEDPKNKAKMQKILNEKYGVDALDDLTDKQQRAMYKDFKAL